MDILRNDTAKQIRNIRKILRSDNTEPLTEDPKTLFSAGAFGVCILLALFLFISSCNANPAHAQEFSNLQYVRAIYLAEGGSHAQFLYGIRSVHYNSPAEAKKICYNTVKANRKRYQRYGYRMYPQFIKFLASRFCPTTGTHLSRSEKKLNQYWTKNVLYFLTHDKTRKV